MSQTAQVDHPESPVATAEPELDRDEASGRFAIDEVRERGLMRPPADDTTPSFASLEDAAPLAEDELEVVAAESAPAATKASLPPPVPSDILKKSLSPKSHAPVAEVVPIKAESALVPSYRGLRPSDRAEPLIEDLSLRLDNPFAGSSLVPPPKKPFPVMKWAAGAVAIVAVSFGGYMLGMRHSQAAAVSAAPQQTVATLASPTPSAPKSPAAVAAAPAAPAVVAPAAVAAQAAPAVAPVAEVSQAPTAAKADEPPTKVAGAAAVAAARVVKPQPVAPTATARETPNAEASVASAPSSTTESSAPAAAASTETVAAAASPAVAETTGEAAAAEAPAAAPAPENLPESPSREDIKGGFESVRAEMETCAAGAHGMATTNVTIAGPTGRVTYATVDGLFAGTPQGSCMARAVRKARFPRFASPTLKVSYPFSL